MDTANENQKTPLILHGHFYQPPRENPRTGIINKQLSANPWGDWNELITADCYRANCHSRYLDAYGSIISLSNNYEALSFNFGPTLLTWLQANDPESYEMIIEADRSSMRRLGHGNAIAQVYSHAILPLATREDARTQILWGLDDFNRRFGRDAEGIWLSETAINGMVIDLLAEEGVRFVILSPWQCRAVDRGGKKLVNLDGKPAPYDRPYLISGEEGGTISAFFYNPQLAEGISFGHYLRDADQLYERLLAIKGTEKPAMIHTATDGEIYGHHEPYGDMALAALTRKVGERNDFFFTNYASYLADNPATERAILHDGEDALGTSWSCFHGVSRWYKDCGCHTGGDESWNQKWRTPLRTALQELGGEVDRLYETEVKAILGEDFDTRALLNSFSPVASKLVPMRQFVSAYTDSPKEQATLASLLLAQKYKHYAFTSCGWFFNDIAGLEPRQNIAYALMALSYCLPFADEELMMNFLSTLSKAKANRKQDGTGESIATEELGQLSGIAEASLFFALRHRMLDGAAQNERYGIFRLISYDTDPAGDRLLIENTDSLSRHLSTVTEQYTRLLGTTYHLTIRDDESGDAQRYTLDMDDIPLRMRDDLLSSIERGFCGLDREGVRKLGKTIRNYSSLTRSVPYLPMGSLHQELVGATLAAFTTLFSNGTSEHWKELQGEYETLVNFFLSYAKQPEREMLATIFDRQIHHVATLIAREGLRGKSLSFILDFLAMVRSHAIEPELRGLQEEVYPYLTAAKTWDGDPTQLDALAGALNFSLTTD